MTQKLPLRKTKSKPVWRNRYVVAMIPYSWLILFSLIPFLFVLKVSFSQTILAIPPYQPLLTLANEGILTLNLNLGNYSRMITDSFYASGFIASVMIALVSTIFCLIFGYLIAYGITRASPKWRMILLLLIILPFWTSFLVRIYAWIGILSKDGLLNNLLLYLGLISEPQQFLYNNFAVTIGIVYCYLPFMVLPIYSTLEKLDDVYIEAAYDLGCRPWQAFWRITVPLSRAGILSGCALVFIPALGEFVIPELLGAPDNLMIGRIIWLEFFNNRDWPIASTVAVVMLILFVVPIMVMQRRQLDRQEGT